VGGRVSGGCCVPPMLERCTRDVLPPHIHDRRHAARSGRTRRGPSPPVRTAVRSALLFPPCFAPPPSQPSQPATRIHPSSTAPCARLCRPADEGDRPPPNPTGVFALHGAMGGCVGAKSRCVPIMYPPTFVANWAVCFNPHAPSLAQRAQAKTRPKRSPFFLWLEQPRVVFAALAVTRPHVSIDVSFTVPLQAVVRRRRRHAARTIRIGQVRCVALLLCWTPPPRLRCSRLHNPSPTTHRRRAFRDEGTPPPAADNPTRFCGWVAGWSC
jgi:hypothetical protein